MISKGKRLFAKELIEKFVARDITSDEFNDNFPIDESDPSLEAIFCSLWPCYSENPAHKLEGKHALDPAEKQLFSRCALFLGSDVEYEWPEYKWVDMKYAFMRLIGRGKRIDEQFELFKKHGEFEVWPFIRREDYVTWAEKSGGWPTLERGSSEV